MKQKPILRFLIKLVSLLAAVLIAVGVINRFYIKGYYYSDVYHEIQKMDSVPYDLKMVNMGTSHGLACFRYPDDSRDSFNFALSGEDIYHDFATLQQFADHLSQGCVVALPVSYFSFCMSTEEPSQKRYYHYLDKQYIRDFRYETLIISKYLPVLTSGEFVIKDLIKDQEMDVGGAMMGGGNNSPEPETGAQEQTQPETGAAAQESATDASATGEEREALVASLFSHAAGRAESWRSGNLITGKKYIGENTALLKEMVEFCYGRGFKPVIVSTPIFYALNGQFAAEELDTCYFDPIKDVCEQTGVPYLDLSHDETLSYEPEYYGNSDHMNVYGAEAFYQRYTEFLKEIKYI